MLRKAIDTMEGVLVQATESRKLGISLQSVQYGDQFREQLLKHGTELEQLYAVMRTLTQASPVNEKKLEKAIALATTKTSWFEKSKATWGWLQCCSQLLPLKKGTSSLQYYR